MADITPAMARQELARRELARRANASSSNQPNQQPQQQPGMLQKAGDWAQQNINQPVENNIVAPALGAIQGLENIPSNVMNLGSYGINKLTGSHIPQAPIFDVAPHTPQAEAGNLASFFAGPGMLKIAGKIPELAHTATSAMKIPIIAQGINAAKNMITKNPMTSNIAGNALLGGAYSPDNPGEGMIAGATAPIAGKVIGSTYNALRPSRFLRGTLTPEELAKNLEITKGTETGLGDVIGSPMLKRLNENILSKIPFSGANEAMMRSAGQTIDLGHGILNKLIGDNKAEDYQQTLNDALQSAYKEHQSNKNTLYNEANSIADKINLKLPLAAFSNKADKYSQALENTNILKYEPEMASMINKLKNYKNPVIEGKNIGSIVDKEGKPIINETTQSYPRLEEANLLKGKLNQLADKYKESPTMTDRHAASVFGDLASSLKEDIVSAIQKSGHVPLSKAYSKAESNYADNFSPFLDKEIYKFSTGNADPDTLISSFIKTGKANDRANLLNKLTEKLPTDKRNLLGYGYLNRAIDENNVLNPLKVKSLLSRNSLGPRQLEALFPDKKIRNSLLNYSSLAEKNTKGLKLMQNPETGQMNMDILPLLSKSPIGLAGKILGAKPLARWLSSPQSRENLVNKMIYSNQ